MTAADFRAQHGDPTDWTPADFDSFQVIAENTGRTPKPVSAHWRQALKDAATQPPQPTPAGA